jgi:hypothetical protein
VNKGKWRLISLLLTSAMFLSASAGFAQKKVPILERTITVSIQNEPIDQALRRIGQAGNFTFSYKSSLFKKDEVVSYDFVNKTVREILDQLFKGQIEYKERGRYIILVKASKTSATSSSTVSGYVIDEATGKRLKNVSVYDPVSLSSAVTDSYGYFKIDIKNPTSEEIKLAVKKREYTDTVVVVPRGNQRLLNVPIRINKDKIAMIADSVGSKIKRFWIMTMQATEQAINMENIADSMTRDFQFSVIPFVGTNGKLSGNVINRYSLNVLGGYSLGNTKLEFGGLFNTTRGDVKGFQAAGLFNGVMGKQYGVQLAGLANASLDSAFGVQGAGLLNLSTRYSGGAKLSGLLNVSLENSNAVQIAGTGNFVLGESRRPQLAGLFNMATEDVRPAQIAGLFNFTAGSVKGAQVAGTFNFAAKDVTGTQVAGIFNVAPKSLRGAQVSLVNVGNSVEGVQLGLVNVSNRMKGVPIGLFSFVGKGYHKLEFSADEIFYTNLAFRTGVRQFYNIFTVGANPETFEQDQTLWTFGYGVGTAPRITKWLYLNLDVTSNQIVYGEIEKINLLNKVYGGFDFQLTKNFSITAGVTLNGHLTDTTYDAYPDIVADYEPDVISERNYGNDLNLKMWMGGKVGIRFF